MAIELTEEQIAFFTSLKDLNETQDNKDPLARLRAKGWDHFEELGLPTRKAEVFQYVNLNKLYGKQLTLSENVSASVADNILPECKNSYIVFVNGQMDLSLSNLTGLPEKVIAIHLKEALKSFGSYINNQVAKNLQEEVDPFAALNAAFIQKALFFYVPPSVVFECPLQIIHVVQGENQLICPRMEFFFGALSEVKVITTVVHNNASGNFFNSVTNFSLEEGAQIEFSRVLFSEEPNGWHFDATRAYLKKDSKLESVIAETGSETFRDDYKVALIGSNAEVHLNGVAMLTERLESHTHVLVDHQAPDCRSLQVFKNSLDGFSKASFEGKIYVHKIAQKTQAFQLNNNLILNEGAKCDSKPNLEIFADDVKASHGATFGSLDDEQLFYLRARGISGKEAKNLLIQGFCFEIIEKIKVPSLLSLAMERATTYLK